MLDPVTTPTVPKYSELLYPTLLAVQANGGSASISEIVDTVVRLEALDDTLQAVLHNGGPQTEIGYRIAWARTYLKGIDLLTNSARGVWALSDEAVRLLSDKAIGPEELQALLEERRLLYIRTNRARRQTADQQASGESVEAVPGEESDWKSHLIATLTAGEFAPAAFERLTQRLLREADFESVTVTGRSGDQGIDGVGIYRLGLLSFPVFFQCKRYKGSVGPHEVRDFRGAMAGRGENGLLITTATFTAEAKREAGRDGATPVELIDGDRLCDLLKHYELGVVTTTRQEEDVSVDVAFFADI